MSNLLDSILNSMEGPPAATPEQRRRAKEEKERYRRVRNQQRQEIIDFRKEVEQMIGDFQASDERSLEFQPLDKIYRTVIYEVAELLGLSACSFGVDQVDRYTVVYAKNRGPSEDERYVRNNGGQWNDEIAARIEAERQKEKRLYEEEGIKPKHMGCTSGRGGGKPRIFIPNGPSYAQKYMHLSTLPTKPTTKNYGEVPSELKRDHRSIEEISNDIQQKKRQKTATVTSTAGASTAAAAAGSPEQTPTNASSENQPPSN